MPVLESPKEEIYAQNRAKGKTQVASYVAAGFCEDDGAACRYESGNVRIKQRIQELTQTAAEKAGITIDWWIDQVKDIVLEAKAGGDYGPAVSALDKLGKHVGVYKEDNEQKTNATAQEEYIKKIQTAKKELDNE